MTGIDLGELGQEIARSAEFAERGREEELRKIAGRIGMQIIAVGTQSQLEQLHASIQNLDRKSISKAWYTSFSPVLDHIDRDALAQNQEVAGMFRVKQDDLSSPLLPGLLEEALKQMALAIQLEIEQATTPEAVGKVFANYVVNHTLTKQEYDTVAIAGIKAAFWDQNGTTPTNIILPMLGE